MHETIKQNNFLKLFHLVNTCSLPYERLNGFQKRSILLLQTFLKCPTSVSKTTVTYNPLQTEIIGLCTPGDYALAECNS